MGPIQALLKIGLASHRVGKGLDTLGLGDGGQPGRDGVANLPRGRRNGLLYGQHAIVVG